MSLLLAHRGISLPRRNSIPFGAKRTLSSGHRAELMSTGPSLKEKLIKIGAKVISHGRSIGFQMAEVVIPRQMLQEIAADRRAAAEAAAGASLTRPWSCVQQP
jgi:hypothetical protein